MIYQAILFLPLIGAIIAGFFGRMIGARASEIVTTLFLLIAAVLVLGRLHRRPPGRRRPRGRGEDRARATGSPPARSRLSWGIRVDTLTAVMLVVVNTVSSLVHLYSIGYMAEDPHRPRFFAYLSLFTFAMLMLVTSDNLLQMFFGWEGVGLASYLLIGFWYHKPEANAAAIKAFIVNRVGDFGFALGIFGVFAIFGSIDLDTIFAAAAGHGRQAHAFPLLGIRYADGALPAPLHGRHGQVGAVPAAHLAAGRHGRPDAGLGPDPRRDHGDGRRLHGGAALAACSSTPLSRSRS